MNRSLLVLVVGSIAAIGFTSLAAKPVPRDAAPSRGAYLYLDAEGIPLNCNGDGAVRPLSAGDSTRAVSRAFVEFGVGGTADQPGSGAICRLPESFTSHRLLVTQVSASARGRR